MKPPPSAIRLVAALLALAIGAAGCSSFHPGRIDELNLAEREQTKTDGVLSVSVVALTAEETEQLFDAPLAKVGVQPVWIRVVNDSENDFLFMPLAVDPEYFSANEVGHLVRSRFTDEGLDEFQRFLDDHHCRLWVPANSDRSGFVYTNLDEGAKVVDIVLVNTEETDVHELEFIVPVPGFKADFLEIDFDAQYAEEEFVDFEHKDELRPALEALPRATLGPDRTTEGDPLNLVVIGDGVDIVVAHVRRGWHLTETTHSGAVWRTIMSSVFGKEYRSSPVSPLYVFDRPQDIALQKARGTVDERNHLRLWRAPMRYLGMDVWVGQISRDIGVRLSSKTLVTHKIDPDVDEARAYLAQDIIFAQAVTEAGFVKGVGAASREEPRHNYTGDPYYTDGLRVVYVIAGDLVSIHDLEPLRWERPVGDSGEPTF